MLKKIIIYITFLYFVFSIPIANSKIDCDTKYSVSFISYNFPIPYSSVLPCYENKTFNGFYQSAMNINGTCNNGIVLLDINPEYMSNSDFQYSESKSSNSLSYRDENIFNNTPCLLVSDNKCLINSNDNTKWYTEGALDKQNFGKRYDIYYHSLLGNSNDSNSKICPIFLNLAKWPEAIYFYQNKSNGTPIIQRFDKTKKQLDFTDLYNLSDDFIKIGNSIIIEGKDNLILLTYNQDSNSLLSYILANSNNELVISLCSYSNSINLSFRDNPHIYTFRRDLYTLNQSKLEVATLSNFREAATELNSIYIYKSSELKFYPDSKINPQIVVEFEINNKEQIKCNARVEYNYNNSKIIKPYINKSLIQFKEWVDLNGVHSNMPEYLLEYNLFPFNKYKTNISIFHYYLPDSDLKEIDINSDYSIAYQINGNTLYIIAQPTSSKRITAYLYMVFILVALIFLFLKGFYINLNKTKIAGTLSVSILDVLGFGSYFGYQTLPMFETYILFIIMFILLLKEKYMKNSKTKLQNTINSNTTLMIKKTSKAPKWSLKARLQLNIYKLKIFLKHNIKKISAKLKFFFKRFFFKSKEDSNMGISINLEGKTAVVFGIANDKSIAWHIAKRLNDAGCRIFAAYQERTEEMSVPLIKTLSNPLYEKCDVVSDELLDSFFKKVQEEFGQVDFLVHSIAFAKREHLQGKFMNIDRRGYQVAHEVSSYSLAELTRRTVPMMKKGGSIIAMTYLGSEKVTTGYNIMGVAKAALESSVRYLASDLGEQKIRVNAISAGPIATLAASGIAGFGEMLLNYMTKAPLKRNITADEVADCALFLCSDLSTGITGQVIFVDAGYNIMGI